MTKKEFEKEAKEYVESVIDVNAFDWKIVREIYLAYLAGGKSREKRIAKLENKLKETEHNKETVAYLSNCTDEIARNIISNLRKENAELKEYNKYLKRKRQGGIQKQYNKVAIINQQDKQLTKAKELLKGIVDTPMYYQMGGEMYESEEYKELITEAEQFLKVAAEEHA